jgi:large subunit ribosomal protein L32e
MKEVKELLKIRKELKKKKPDFMRQDAHKKKRLKTSWRRSRGSQSKMRLELKGYRRNIEIGWGSPKAVYGLSKEGLKKVIVNNVNDLKKIDSKKEGAVISGSVGLRKKLEIVKEAETLKIKILNIKDPQKFIKDSEESRAKEKQEKEERQKEKEKKKTDKKKEKKKEEKTIEEAVEVSDEEKKKQDKEEKDKLLTKKQ